MTAIDETAKVKLYLYTNKNWHLQEVPFLTSMESKDIREYFGFNDHLYSNEYINIYYNKARDKKSATYTYIVEVDFFHRHKELIVCPSYIDLLSLLNEMKGLTNIYSIDELQEDVKQIKHSLENMYSVIKHNT